jgi:hypothetical protein
MIYANGHVTDQSAFAPDRHASRSISLESLPTRLTMSRAQGLRRLSFFRRGAALSE